jgi:protein required for attachment to host cells
MNTCILVASRIGARLFLRENHHLTLVKSIEHPEGRKNTESEAPRSSDRHAKSRNANDRESAHERAAKQFARSLATLLQGRRIEHKMDRVVLVAEPHMLGLIKGELDPVTRGLVIQTISKDLHAATEQVVFDHVKTISPVPPLS